MFHMMSPTVAGACHRPSRRLVAALAGIFVFVALGGAVPHASAHEADAASSEATLQRLADTLARAASRGDLKAIARIETELAALAKTAPPASGLAREVAYFQAAAAFRKGTIDRAGGRDALENCLERLEALLQQERDFAEGYILEAACAGALMGSAPQRGMELSMRAQRALQMAKELDPENPRGAFVEGLGIFFTPRNFGGGPAIALGRFEDAVRFFEKEEKETARDPRLIDWGRDEALMWYGIALSTQGRRDEALKALRKAAEINPEEQWITTVLIPRVEAGRSLGEIFGVK